MGLFSRKGRNDADRDLAEDVGSGTSEGDDNLVTEGHTGRPVSRHLDEQEQARIEAGVQRLQELGIDIDDVEAIGSAYDAALARSRADASADGGPDVIVDTFAIAIGEHLARHSAREWAVVTDVFGTDLGLVAARADTVIVPHNLVGARWMRGESGWVPRVVSHLVGLRPRSG